MTFSVSRDQGAFEWAGKNLATVFCQPRRLFDPQMWRMVYDVVRFNASARNFLLSVDEDKPSEKSIGDYLEQEGYSEAFRNNYLIVGYFAPNIGLLTKLGVLADDGSHLEYSPRKMCS